MESTGCGSCFEHLLWVCGLMLRGPLDAEPHVVALLGDGLLRFSTCWNKFRRDRWELHKAIGLDCKSGMRTD